MKRRLQDSLVVIGTGILVFGAWTLLKFLLLIFLQDAESQRQFFHMDQEDVPLYIIYIALGIIATFDLGSRLFVYLSARAEGFGRRKGYAYLLIAGIMAILSTLSVITAAQALVAIDAGFFESLVTLTIEGTSAVILVMLIVNSVRLKRLTRATGREAAATATATAETIGTE